jgi:hypothetical protein
MYDIKTLYNILIIYYVICEWRASAVERPSPAMKSLKQFVQIAALSCAMHAKMMMTICVTVMEGVIRAIVV